MSAELDLSTPEIPEPTLLESILRYGLFLGAIFQLICILAVIFPSSKGHEQFISAAQSSCEAFGASKCYARLRLSSNLIKGTVNSFQFVAKVKVKLLTE
uniref:Protein MANBAL n=1 Tax=Astatotilapia calliptera TaxID=8154 RepID=A0AAX7U6F4_ASTCA